MTLDDLIEYYVDHKLPFTTEIKYGDTEAGFSWEKIGVAGIRIRNEGGEDFVGIGYYG